MATRVEVVREMVDGLGGRGVVSVERHFDQGLTNNEVQSIVRKCRNEAVQIKGSRNHEAKRVVVVDC